LIVEYILHSMVKNHRREIVLSALVCAIVPSRNDKTIARVHRAARTAIRADPRSGKLNRLDRKWIAAVLQHICEINDGIGGAFVTPGGGMPSRQQVGSRSAGSRQRVGCKGLQRGLSGTNGGRRIAVEDRGRTRWERKGSDVLPVSIIIGGWLTGRRFAPHNSRRPIILPRLPCTNSYITRRHVLPHRYIITQNSLLHTTTPFRATIEDCGKPRIRAVHIANMTIMHISIIVVITILGKLMFKLF